jgi:hypothetical protein
LRVAKEPRVANAVGRVRGTGRTRWLRVAEESSVTNAVGRVRAARGAVDNAIAEESGIAHTVGRVGVARDACDPVAVIVGCARAFKRAHCICAGGRTPHHPTNPFEAVVHLSGHSTLVEIGTVGGGITSQAGITGADEAPQRVGASSVAMTVVRHATLVDIGTREPVARESRVADAAVGVDAALGAGDPIPGEASVARARKRSHRVAAERVRITVVNVGNALVRVAACRRSVAGVPSVAHALSRIDTAVGTANTRAKHAVRCKTFADERADCVGADRTRVTGVRLVHALVDVGTGWLGVSDEPSVAHAGRRVRTTVGAAGAVKVQSCRANALETAIGIAAAGSVVQARVSSALYQLAIGCPPITAALVEVGARDAISGIPTVARTRVGGVKNIGAGGIGRTAVPAIFGDVRVRIARAGNGAIATVTAELVAIQVYRPISVAHAIPHQPNGLVTRDDRRRARRDGDE